TCDGSRPKCRDQSPMRGAVPMKPNGFERSRALFRRVALVGVAAGCGIFAASDAPGQTDARRGASDRIRVNCGAGETIGRALRHAQPGDSIVVTGTCRE